MALDCLSLNNLKDFLDCADTVSDLTGKDSHALQDQSLIAIYQLQIFPPSKMRADLLKEASS